MQKCNLDRLYRVVMTALREHKINPKWHSMGRLLDALATYGADNDDVIAYLCETMHADVNVTRSTFIGPFFTYSNIGIYVTNDVNTKPTAINGQNAIPRHRDEQRKPKVKKLKPVGKLPDKVDKLRRRQ